MLEKIKQFIESDKGKDIMTIAIVVLVGISSFGLGRLSKDSENKELMISQEPTSQVANIVNTDLEPQITKKAVENKKTSSVPTTKPEALKSSFFASKRGHKYYPAGCNAGQTIKLENRIYFDTRAEAEQAGYELSTSCR